MGSNPISGTNIFHSDCGHLIVNDFTIIACESDNSIWSIRLTVRTTDFHSVNRGSIPLYSTIDIICEYN